MAGTAAPKASTPSPDQPCLPAAPSGAALSPRMDTAAGAAPLQSCFHLWRQEEEANPAAVSVGAVQVWATPSAPVGAALHLLWVLRVRRSCLEGITSRALHWGVTGGGFVSRMSPSVPYAAPTCASEPTDITRTPEHVVVTQGRQWPQQESEKPPQCSRALGSLNPTSGLAWGGLGGQGRVNP